MSGEAYEHDGLSVEVIRDHPTLWRTRTFDVVTFLLARLAHVAPGCEAKGWPGGEIGRPLGNCGPKPLKVRLVHGDYDDQVTEIPVGGSLVVLDGRQMDALERLRFPPSPRAESRDAVAREEFTKAALAEQEARNAKEMASVVGADGLLVGGREAYDATGFAYRDARQATRDAYRALLGEARAGA